jgi:hypothetical protein
MPVACEHPGSFHRYGSDDPTPDNARIADGVSVVRCGCGKICLRFHHPATTTHPGRVFAAAYLKPSDCANIGDDVLKALDRCRHNIPCDGRHS